ncbi:MAG: hypothetical protein SFX18_09050 [Pirellulales bacterium]|nr:hypothetical protein [Pirellulales bacterium]
MWNDKTLQVLDAWIGPDWRKPNHPADLEFFHRFVLAVWDETHSLWDQSEVREFIRKRILESHKLSEDYLIRFVDNNILRGSNILDFLAQAKDEGRKL